MGLASNSALFASSALAEREVTMPDGTVLIVHFGKVSGMEWSQFQFAMGMGDEEARARASCRLVMLSLREPDGKQALTWEQAKLLEAGVVQQMMRHAADLNRPTQNPGKASPPGESSGSGTS